MTFSNNFLEDIDHLFKNCGLPRQIWNTIAGYCLNPNNNDIQFIDCIEFIFRNEKSYRTTYKAPLEKIIGITWTIWTHRNNAVFKNWKVNPGQVINFAERTFHDIEYFNNVSDLFQQVTDDRVKCSPAKEIRIIEDGFHLIEVGSKLM